MRPIFIPDLAKALRADWAPGPGVFVLKQIKHLTTFRHQNSSIELKIIWIFFFFNSQGTSKTQVQSCHSVAYPNIHFFTRTLQYSRWYFHFHKLSWKSRLLTKITVTTNMLHKEGRCNRQTERTSVSYYVPNSNANHAHSKHGKKPESSMTIASHFQDLNWFLRHSSTWKSKKQFPELSRRQRTLQMGYSLLLIY